MAIITKQQQNRPVDYVQLTFGRNGKAPLGMSLPKEGYKEFIPVEGIGGVIRKVHVRTKEVGPGNQMEVCTLYFADQGEERGSALQFATGGPEKYSFAAGHLVARLLACQRDDEIHIMSYVFKSGTTGKDREGNEYVRQTDELAVVVNANGHKIMQPNWGVDDEGTPLSRGPDAPFIKNPSTGRDSNERDFTMARAWMVDALKYLNVFFNRQSHSEAHQQADSAPISLDDLPDNYVEPAPAAGAPQRQYAGQRE